MALETRHPKENELPKLKALWKQAFGDTDEYIDLFFKGLFCFEDAVALFADGELASMAMLIPCELKAHGAVYQLSYLYAMATDEMFRGRGYGQTLLHFAAQVCRSRGDDGIALVPADDGLTRFYARAGYEPAFSAKPSSTDCVVYDERYLRHIEQISAMGEITEDELLPPGMLLRLNDRIPSGITAYLQYPMN